MTHQNAYNIIIHSGDICWSLSKAPERPNMLQKSPRFRLAPEGMKRTDQSIDNDFGGNTMKTFMASPATIDRKWYVVDATDMTLGRLASEVAKVLRGKNKPIFTPHIDTGDNVIVINAEKVKVTGKKLDQKIYYHHSDYVGGMKEQTLKEKLDKKPEQVIELAVKGMLPKGPLGRQMYKKLHVYAGPDHKHAAQKPEVLTF